MFTKKALLSKTINVGKLTAASRALGILREMLMTRYLGATALSDVFIAAFSIPNFLRKIFAEGALSATFVPEIVRSLKRGRREIIDSFMSLSFLIFEGIVLVLCVLLMWQSEWIIALRVPGFSPGQVKAGADFLRILAPIVFFLSSSSLLAGALQAIGKFRIPAAGPVILNIVFVSTLFACLYYNLPIKFLCFGIVLAGLVLLVLHVDAYFGAQFSFGSIRAHDYQTMKTMFARFLFSVIAMSSVEIKLFIDSYFASYLESGSISIIYYAERFMGIPLGIVATSFATVLLPHLSHIRQQEPEKLSFYLFEACKLVLWATAPIIVLMMFFANDIFITLFISEKFSMAHALQAGFILRIYVLALFNYSMNKIVHNFFFSMQVTWIPAAIALASAFLNIILNILFMPYFKAGGLVAASNIAVWVETIALLFVLARTFTITLPVKQVGDFFARASMQTISYCALFIVMFYGIKWTLLTLFPSFAALLTTTWLFWVWVGPLLALTAFLFLKNRRWWEITLYFLDE